MQTRNSRQARLLLLGTATAVSTVVGWSACFAQDAKSDSVQVGEVVVTAQRRSENIQQVPLSIQAFTGDNLRDLGIKSSSDLGQLATNVDIALPAGAGNQPIISIRGIGLNDYDTNNAGPNGIYVDEVYLSAPASQTFQTFDLERVEVLKGPQGTLYGRNTSGGAINFITNKPTDQFSADAHAEYSSYNTFNLEGGVGGPISPTLDGRVAVVVNESDGYVKNLVTGDHENGQNNYAARVQLLWKPIDRLKVLFNVHGGQVDNRPTEYRHIGALDASTGAPCSVAQTKAGGCVDLFGYGTPAGFYTGSYNRQDHLRVNSIGSYVNADYDLGAVKLTSISSYEHNDKKFPEDSDASPNRLLEINFGVRSDTFTQELRASGGGVKYDWVAGAYYLHESLKQNQPIFILLDADNFFGGPGAGDGIAERAFDQSEQVTNAYAAFGQGDYNVTDRLKLTLGARVTNENRTFHYVGQVQVQDGGADNFGPVTNLADTRESLDNTAFSYRVALDYHFTPAIHAYASVASGYKSGDFNGSFLSTDPAEIARQLLPVKPETVTAYEVGLKASLFQRRVSFDVAGFYNEYDDLQVFVLVPPVAGSGTGLPVNVLDNAKSAHTLGIDASVTAKPTTGLTLTANLGILDTELDTFVSDVGAGQRDYSGNQLPLSPHASFSGIADYKFPVGAGQVDVQFSASYKGHQFFDISNDRYTTQSGYWLENARIAYALPDRRWEVAAFIRNLSGKKYFVDAFDLINPFGLVQGITGTPRTVGVEVNYKY